MHCRINREWCESREEDYASPARSIRKPAKEKSRDRVLDDAELKLTWEAAEEVDGPAGALVKLLILSGARRNEITELARQEIKSDAIELPGERTKNGLPHSIPLTAMMRRVPDSSGFLRRMCARRTWGDHEAAGVFRYSRYRGGTKAAMGTPAAGSDAMKNRRRTTAKAKRPSAPKVRGRRKSGGVRGRN
jgi:integrase